MQAHRGGGRSGRVWPSSAATGLFGVGVSMATQLITYASPHALQEHIVGVTPTAAITGVQGLRHEFQYRGAILWSNARAGRLTTHHLMPSGTSAAAPAGHKHTAAADLVDRLGGVRAPTSSKSLPREETQITPVTSGTKLFDVLDEGGSHEATPGIRPDLVVRTDGGSCLPMANAPSS
ncbi:hypothetical protein Micbo1qcDRAFT_222676 [Microdochium bolleyi]|uniref:Uncharacterized protein n=1 Tax=Microdochium bolleyi TaxID=196109 RepID=A0A136J720_9PEZI|nr:hypothetical protein Micbo1qcDRAFT_222676 [Microdochium bolleyi]